jgi:hypothetical protein
MEKFSAGNEALAKALADANINVDMIVQTASHVGGTQRSGSSEESRQHLTDVLSHLNDGMRGMILD